MQFALYLSIIIAIGVVIYLLKQYNKSAFNKELSHSQLDRFTIDNLPFVYQSEYYSLAWGREQKGFYVDPEGRKYKYKMPEKWHRHKTTCERHSWGDETDGTISATELFENLGHTIEAKPLFKFMRRTTPITQTMIDDLLISKTIEGYGHCCTDSGILSNSLFVYDSESDLYRRILLNSYGEMEKVNQSIYANKILQGLGIVRR